MLTSWKESYDQPRQHIKKQRHYFANKGPSSQGYGFSSSHVWMWELEYKESWAPKNWCFWTVCWRRLLRVPWTARRSNQSILKEISPGCSLEGLMLKLKLQYIGHLMRRSDSFEKTLTLGKIEGRRRGDDRGWEGWMASPTQWTWVWVDSGSWWWTGRPGMLWFMGSQRVGHDWATELNWTERVCNTIKGLKQENLLSIWGWAVWAGFLPGIAHMAAVSGLNGTEGFQVNSLPRVLKLVLPISWALSPTSSRLAQLLLVTF